MHSTWDSEERRVRQLVVVFAPDRQIPPPMALEGGPLRIGRDRDAALVLEDGDVSRNHAEARYDDAIDRWVVRDCGSRNGLWVNGVRVERAELVHGMVLRLGRTLLVVVDVTIAAGQQLGHETHALRGHSLAMQQVRGEIATLVGQRISVLVLGETGVGKELVARDLHARSGRSGPFLAVNCATLPSVLSECEVFGRATGPWLGAFAPRDDRLFGRVRGGTLFLDEIGGLPAAVQPTLLRVLSEVTVPRIGREEPAEADVQVIATTHRDLVKDVASGGFQAELYEKLAGRVMRVPPLRERREDILGLAQAVLDRWQGGKFLLSDRAAEKLLLHDWPFNVRELEHAIETAVVRAEGNSVIGSRNLPLENGERVQPRQVLRICPVRSGELAQGTVPSEAELRKLLVEHGGNVLHVARALKKDRQQLYRWFKRYAIDVAAIRGERRTDD
ncbi:MAG TPA: sigma 54-interacting transcriptional regulator [Kofleriaceae bacterium]|jgi:DNA-binding NtrC family response regulator|nr:sigma 54-interacting transcriptional regulator [Kofleriaceae bacterium]